MPTLPAGLGMREPAEYTELAQQMGPGIKGKVLIDATNPLTPYPVMDILWNGTSGQPEPR